MPFSREDWRELKAKKAKKDNDPSRYEFAMRAAIDAELMSGSEEWDKFLTYLQKILEDAEKTASSLEEQLLAPHIFEHEKLAYLKSQHIRYKERADVLKFVMSFPKEIIKTGKVAKKKLLDL